MKQIKIIIAGVLLSALSCVTAFAAGETATENTGFMSIGIYIIIALLVIAVIALILAFVLKRTKQDTSVGGGNTSIDKLTGLGNKRHAERYFNNLDRSDYESVCMAYIAFDAKRFTVVNDREKCDDLQKTAGKLLAAFCGETDYAARIDDGAFIIGATCSNMVILQQRINDLVNNLNKIQSGFADKSTYPFRAGLFLESDKIGGFEISLNNAIVAYNYACDNQLNLYVCTNELLKNESYRTCLREKLDRAIDDGQFCMFLQFIYSPSQDKFTCAEVLSRWGNPMEGFMMPAYYINDMRTTGLIKKFDMYMLEKTCRVLKEWSDTPFGDLRLSCNITRVTISSVEFVRDFQNILKKYKFDRSKLMLEITEDTLIDKAIAYQNIVFCKDEGVHVAIDDLCAGHSSLEDLSDYPVDQVKLSRHMIVRTASKRGNALLQELINMAHRMDLEVVCEGIENEEQRNAVIDNGCDLVQGYYFSYVFPLDEAKDFYLKSLKEGCNPSNYEEELN